MVEAGVSKLYTRDRSGEEADNREQTFFGLAERGQDFLVTCVFRHL